MRTARTSLGIALLALLACPLPVSAQKYPDRSIRLVVAFPTGAPYILALHISEKLRESLGQSVVPDFRAGAGGNIASELVANALGVCDAACEYAMQFAKTQRRGGKLLFDQQLVQLQLNEMHMLTEALRSYVMRTAWEMDRKVQGVNAVLVMNYSTPVMQRVTRLNLEIHSMAGGIMDAVADKLVRDAFIWSHLAGDTTQRLKAVRRFPKNP